MFLLELCNQIVRVVCECIQKCLLCTHPAPERLEMSLYLHICIASLQEPAVRLRSLLLGTVEVAEIHQRVFASCNVGCTLPCRAQPATWPAIGDSCFADLRPSQTLERVADFLVKRARGTSAGYDVQRLTSCVSIHRFLTVSSSRRFRCRHFV